MIYDYQTCHGFTYHVDAGNGGNIVSALNGDSGGMVVGIDGVLFQADGGYGFDSNPEDDFIAIRNAGENTACVAGGKPIGCYRVIVL